MKLLPIAVVLLGLTGAAQAGTVTFDDLASPPALAGATGLYYANNSSDSYAGVVWDTRFVLAGDEYRIDNGTDTRPPGPLFGLPRSGHFFVTNGNGGDGLTMTTTQVLTSAWFGQNEYYGFGGGADRITVSALNGATVLGSVSMDLPDANPGQPETLQRMDTSAFVALSGITGYRIDRRTQGIYADSWVGDDFVFQSPVPEVSSAGLLALGLGGLLMARSGRTSGQASRARRA